MASKRVVRCALFRVLMTRSHLPAQSGGSISILAGMEQLPQPLESKMTSPQKDHYAVLGLERHCTEAEVRTAYRLLARKFHPDVNPGSAEALRRTQELNTAYEVLSDSVRRKEYDARAEDGESPKPHARQGVQRNIEQEVRLRIEDLLRGTRLEIRVNDPANPDGPESYSLDIPPGTAPGSRHRIPRDGAMQGGTVIVKVRLLPGGRFKARGKDLQTDLRISTQRAAKGGMEFLPGPAGGMVRVVIPAAVPRGSTLKIPNEGLPNARGGRGDLLVRVTYNPEVRITRR